VIASNTSAYRYCTLVNTHKSRTYSAAQAILFDNIVPLTLHAVPHVTNDPKFNNPFLHLHTLLSYTFHKRVYLHFLNAKLSYHISLVSVLVFTIMSDCITKSRLVKRILQVLTQQLGVEIFRACTSVWRCVGISLRHVWIRRGDHISYSRPRYQAKRRLPVGVATEEPPRT